MSTAHDRPLCCERDSLPASKEATGFTGNFLCAGIRIKEKVYCNFGHLNRECREMNNPFYSNISAL